MLLYAQKKSCKSQHHYTSILCNLVRKSHNHFLRYENDLSLMISTLIVKRDTSILLLKFIFIFVSICCKIRILITNVSVHTFNMSKFKS